MKIYQRAICITLVVVAYMAIFACGSSDPCTTMCQHITDDAEWDQCILACHQLQAAKTPLPPTVNPNVEKAEVIE